MHQGDHLVEGYELCARGCETWVRAEVASRTAGACPECFAAEGGKVVRTAELIGRGMRVTIPLGDRPKRRKRELSEARKARKREATRAADAARKRLAAMLPDLYDVVLADERASRGLEPWPTEIAVRGGDASDEIAFALLVTTLEQNGIDTR